MNAALFQDTLSSGASRHLLPAGEKGLAATFAPSSPQRGEGGSRSEPGEGACAAIVAEGDFDASAREALLDRAMGTNRKRKSSEKLRRGRRPSEGLAFVSRGADGAVVGTVRLWDVAVKFPSPLWEGVWDRGKPGPCSEAASVGTKAGAPSVPPPLTPSHKGEGDMRALLLGPLAVEPALKACGIGSALMRHAVEEARRLGHRAILLVGDAPYYARFGFSAEKTGDLAMPGPYEKHRLLALELVPGALDGAHGVIRATGRKTARTETCQRRKAA